MYISLCLVTDIEKKRALFFSSVSLYIFTRFLCFYFLVLNGNVQITAFPLK